MTRLICQAGSTHLVWVQPSLFLQLYELRSSKLVLASLLWKRKSAKVLGEPNATAVAADGAWTFQSTHFAQPRVTIRSLGGYLPVATLEHNWDGSGQLEVSSQIFTWQTIDHLGRVWAFFDAGGGKLLEFQANDRTGRKIAQVTLEPVGLERSEISLLTLLGWYLILLNGERPNLILTAQKIT